MRRSPRLHLRSAPLISLALIASIWAEGRLFHAPVGDADAYHARVREVAERLPLGIESWVGTPIDPLPAATPLLKPNVVLRRNYLNSTTGEQVALMIVQSRDARDMGAHTPSLCYPARGRIHRGSERRDLVVGDLTIPGSLHHFADRSGEMYVYHFFVRPDGVISGGRTGVRDAEGDPRLKAFGAAQFHLELGPSVAQDRRDDVCRTLLSGISDVLDVVRGGVVR